MLSINKRGVYIKVNRGEFLTLLSKVHPAEQFRDG
jgi:hypothetical protein